MDNKLKITGLSIVLIITALTFGNALTGHGIKGNKNLNSEVFANGSNSNSSSGTDGNKGTKFFRDMKDLNTVTEPPYKKGTKICYKYTVTYTLKCLPEGFDDCIPGKVTNKGENCVEPEVPE